MWKHGAAIAIAVALLFVADPHPAAGQLSSPKFRLDAGDGTASSPPTMSSPSFRLDGTTAPVVERPSSTSFTVESGVAVKPYCGDGFVDTGEACDFGTYGSNVGGVSCAALGFASGTLRCTTGCRYDTSGCAARSITTSTGGGGGGTSFTFSAGLPNAPTFHEGFIAAGYFTYLPSVLIYGAKPENTSTVEVNSSSIGVEYPSIASWNARVTLRLGDNVMSINAINLIGRSPSATANLVRRRRGDANGDTVVNDYDLSTFVRLWKSTQRHGDFNVDGTVDDYDLSLLIAHWDVGR